MLKLSTSKGIISIDMPEMEENGITISFSESEISIKKTTIEEKRNRKPKTQKEKSVVESTDLTLEEAITTEKESVEEVDAPKADPEMDPETECILTSALERFRRMGANKATPVSRTNENVQK